MIVVTRPVWRHTQVLTFLPIVLVVALTVVTAPTHAFWPQAPLRKNSNNNLARPRLCQTGKDHFDMDELRNRIAQDSNPFHKLFSNEESHHQQQHHNHSNSLKRPCNVFIILFEPDTEHEGVHTIEYPKGSGSNVILAFASLRDCKNFAEALRKQQFFDPTPQEMNLANLEAYGEALGVFVQLVPEGMDLIPPSENVKELGRHDPSLFHEKKHLDYVFDMDGADLEEDGLMVMEEVGVSWE